MIVDLALNPDTLVFEHCYVHLKDGVKIKKGDRPKPEDLVIRPESNALPLTFTPRLISPSQLDQFLPSASGCERKWAFQYVHGIRSPPTKAQEFGTEMHAQLEDWLKDAKPPASDLLMSSGALAHFPPPRSPGLSVEGVFVFRARRAPDPFSDYTRQHGVPPWVYFWGFMDAMVTSLIDVEVQDLKTTADLIWAKESYITLEKPGMDSFDFRDVLQEARELGKLLDEDTQGVIYSLAGMLAANRKAARLKWVYVQTRGAKTCKAVPAELTWAEAVAAFLPKFLAAERIPELRERKGLTALELPANPSACGAYGGCPFKSDCTDVSVVTSLASQFAQDKLKSSLKEKNVTISTSAVMAKLDAKLAGKASNGVPVQEVGKAAVTTAPAETAQPPVTVVTTEAADETISLKERMRRSREAANATAAETLAPPAAGATFVAVPPAPAQVTNASEAVDINGWPGVITYDGKKAVCTVTAAGETEIYKHLSRDEVIKLAQVQTSQAPPPPPVEAPAKKTRTRRAPAADAGEAAPPARELTVYIDVVTHNGPAIAELAELLEPLQTAVASAAGVDDYRLIPYDDAKKAVAVAFAKSFGGADAPKGEYGISSKVLDKYVLEVLMKEAIIRKGVIW